MSQQHIPGVMRRRAGDWRASLYLLALLYSVVLVVAPDSARAANPLELPAQGLLFDLKYQAMVRADPEGELDPKALFDSDAGFVSYDPALDDAAPPIWLKLELQAASGAHDRYVLLISRRFFQRFELYTAMPDGGLVRRSASVDHSLDGQTFGRDYVMPITLPPGEPVTLLLHVETVQQSLKPLELRVQDRISFSDSRRDDTLIYGLIFGALMALVFHNLVLYLNLRLRGHLYYVIAVVGLLVMLGLDSGLLQTYLLPEMLSPWAVRLNALSAVVMMITISLFFLAFVEARRHSPRLVLVVWLLIGLLMLNVAALLLVPPTGFLHLALLLQPLLVVTLLVLLAGSFFAGRKGVVEGYVFLAAWSLFVAAGVTQTMVSHDVMSRAYFMEYLLYFGAVAEASILSLGLSYRVRQLYARHETALREQNRIARLANLDPLTQTYNRRFLENYLGGALQEAGRGGLKGSVLMLDLDKFKPANDEHGHAAGDLILQEFVKRCHHVMRESDILCRLGGDEFVIVVHDREDSSGLHVAGRIVSVVGKRPFMFGDVPIAITASIGVVAKIPSGVTVSDVLRMADEALYRAKHSGRNRCVLYQSGWHAPVRHVPSAEGEFHPATSGSEQT